MRKKSFILFQIDIIFLVVIASSCGKNVREETPKEELDRMVHEEREVSSEKKS
ncbi:MAG: hypothetical protein HYZ47_03150 [Simkania negevensis]|nr:hypothetical protein [Simkania negevensis]